MAQSIQSGKMAGGLLSLDSNRGVDELNSYKHLAKSNMRKAAAILLLGGLFYVGGVLFQTATLSGLTEKDAWAIRVSLVVIGIYLGVEAFLLWLKSYHCLRLLQEANSPAKD